MSDDNAGASVRYQARLSCLGTSSKRRFWFQLQRRQKVLDKCVDWSATTYLHVTVAPWFVRSSLLANLLPCRLGDVAQVALARLQSALVLLSRRGMDDHESQRDSAMLGRVAPGLSCVVTVVHGIHHDDKPKREVLFRRRGATP